MSGRPSPLQQAGISATRHPDASLSIGEIAAPALLRLHSLQPPGELAAALAQAGIPLPLEVNACAGSDPQVLCLRRGEWLMVCNGSAPHVDLLARLGAATDPARSALLDLSDGCATLRVAGPAARWLLGKFSGLDFEELVAGAGARCARTRFAHAAVIVYCPPVGAETPGHTFDLVFDRSLAPYLWDLLLDAAPHAAELSRLSGP